MLRREKVKEFNRIRSQKRAQWKVWGITIKSHWWIQELTCTATILECIEATCTPVAPFPSYTWYTVTLAFLWAVIWHGARCAAVTGQAAKACVQPIIAMLFHRRGRIPNQNIGYFRESWSVHDIILLLCKLNTYCLDKDAKHIPVIFWALALSGSHKFVSFEPRLRCQL